MSSQNRPNLPKNKKIILLVRHGQATHNVGSLNIRDPKLTSLGEQQCKEILLPFTPQLIVTSPLYRTLQTTTIAFEHLNIPMIANPDIQETKAGILDCDTGIEAEILKKKFPNVVMDHLEKNWYLPQVNVETRIQRFKKWLNERKEQIIVVVSHAGIILSMIPGAQFKNAEVRTYLFDGQDFKEYKN